jgi:hypothetical protein
VKTREDHHQDHALQHHRLLLLLLLHFHLLFKSLSTASTLYHEFIKRGTVTTRVLLPAELKHQQALLAKQAAIAGKASVASASSSATSASSSSSTAPPHVGVLEAPEEGLFVDLVASHPPWHALTSNLLQHASGLIDRQQAHVATALALLEG